MLSGEITDHGITGPDIMAQVRELGPESFPTRQLQSFYLGWFYRLTVTQAAENVRVETHRATVTAVTDTELGHTVDLDSGGTITSDAVIYTVGHTDSMCSNTQLTRERTTNARGGLYAPPAYTNDVDYSPVRAAIPDSRYRVDLASIDRPFEDMFFEDPQQVQDALVRYIERDLTLRTHPDHSETQALFLALLRTYMEVGRLVPLEHLDDESQRLVPGWWHSFFSFVDSGPLAHRLQELLALHRAGFITFLGPDLEVTTAHQDAPEGTPAFRARSRAGGADVSANSWIEARLPGPTLVSSADPALHHVHSSGAGVEQNFETEDGATVSTGKLVVESTAQVVGHAGAVQSTVFAAGNFTSAWNMGAFARPHANSAPFRQCDELTRTVLSALGLPVVPAS